MNTRSRDRIIFNALDMIDSPSLDERERPDGTNYTGSLVQGWLEDCLGQAYNLWPQAGILQNIDLALTINSSYVDLPPDFIKDFKDGIILDSGTREYRLQRRSMDQVLAFKAATRGIPRLYVALPAPQSRLYIRPIPEVDLSAILWYYAMPAMPGGSDIPIFPDDFCITEYLRLRGQEWVHQVAPGTADQYLQGKMAMLAKAGLGNEAENDVFQVDRRYFPGDPGPRDDNADWMGDSVPGGLIVQ